MRSALGWLGVRLGLEVGVHDVEDLQAVVQKERSSLELGRPCLQPPVELVLSTLVPDVLLQS